MSPGAAPPLTPEAALALAVKHGIVLVSGKPVGAVPSLSEAVARAPIRGSWWGHAHGHAIFAALGAVAGSPDFVILKLLGAGRRTFVHRRLWGALATLADAGVLAPARLVAVREQHLPSGRHEKTEHAYPTWLPAGVARPALTIARELVAAAGLPEAGDP